MKNHHEKLRGYDKELHKLVNTQGADKAGDYEDLTARISKDRDWYAEFSPIARDMFQRANPKIKKAKNKAKANAQ